MGYPILGARGYLSGFNALTATSVSATTVTATNLVGQIGASRNFGPMIAGDTGTLTTTAGRCYAQYLGRVPKALTSIYIHYYLSGTNAVAGAGGASVNWAEAAIGTGALGDHSSAPSITPIAYTSIDASVTAAATAWRSVTVTGTIPADTDLWALVAASYETTQPTFRIPVNWVNGRGYAATKNTTQPSLVLGVAQTFTSSPTAGTVVPFMSAQW